ncbi:MAG: DNA-directed RNA polymerase subunit gamma, partial [Microcystaceae cyanobacterium]
ACHNILSPATGNPIVAPSQDMVLVCYYLTAENPKVEFQTVPHFASIEDALRAFDQGQLPLHAKIWVRHADLDVVTEKPDKEVLELQELEDGTVMKYYRERKVRETATGEVLTQYIKTTPGRIIYNKTIEDALVIA